MISRFNYKPPKQRDSSKDDEFSTFTYEKRIRVISNNEDGSVDKYVQECFWKEDKSSWKDFIKEYDLGSVSKQVLDHLSKGTPLVTAHTLPPADYTKIEKGAEIKRELDEKGITLDMLAQAMAEAMIKESKPASSSEVEPQIEGGSENA